MEVRGSVTDRPWGLTLGAISLRRHTGQLAIESDGKSYAIAFNDGAMVGASSPLAADAIARVALTNHFITSTQVADIMRRLAASPDRDEVDVLADVVRFSPDQVLKLRHRLVAQRAARTFALEHGEFVLDEQISLPVFPGVAVDHRHVIYLGVRTNVSEQRLLDDLRQLGSHFVLKPEAIDELPRYGFESNAQPVLEALKRGTSLPELEASHRELDPRFAQAIIYALVSCTACTMPRSGTQPPIARSGTQPPIARSATPLRDQTASRTTPLSESAASRTTTKPMKPAALRTRTETVDPGPERGRSRTRAEPGDANAPHAQRSRERTTPAPRTAARSETPSADRVPPTPSGATLSAERLPSPPTISPDRMPPGATLPVERLPPPPTMSADRMPPGATLPAERLPPPPTMSADRMPPGATLPAERLPPTVPADRLPPTMFPGLPTGLAQPLATGTDTFPSTPENASHGSSPRIRQSTTPPAGARVTTSPFASRTRTSSPSAYSGTSSPDAGTNTPAATRSKSQTEPPPGPARPQTRSTSPSVPQTPTRAQTPTPAPERAQTPTTPSPGRTRTAVGPSATRGPAPGLPPVEGATQLDPAPSRADTDEVKFAETPTPLPASAKQRAVFSEPQPTRAATSRDSRPTLGRAPTPADLEAMRGFADQRTPGFADQRTPGFGDQRTPLGQRTPAEHRTPTDPGLLAGMANLAQSRVSTDNAVDADAAFKRGELAMKRDQPGEAILEFKTACDLNPLEVDYAGMLAWAKFCAAGDKPGIGAETRKILERAVFKSQRPERARFYLGRVERMLGRDKEALRHFQEVLDLKPNHADALSEIRAIEARLAAAKGGSGLFGRKR